MTTIKINPDEFLEDLPSTDEGKYIATEDAVNRYLTDLMNEAGIDTELRYKDGNYFIYLFEHEVVSLFPMNPDDPVGSLVEAVKWFVNEISDVPGLEAWYTYKKGNQTFTIETVPIPVKTE